jgi:hypothetical protein
MLVFFIDGQVRLVRWRTDNFGLFLRNKNRQTTNFRLHDEQGNKENGTDVCLLQTEKANLRLFSANRNGSLFSLVGKR